MYVSNVSRLPQIIVLLWVSHMEQCLPIKSSRGEQGWLSHELIVTIIRFRPLVGTVKNAGAEISRNGVRRHLQGNFWSKTLDIDMTGILMLFGENRNT